MNRIAVAVAFCVALTGCGGDRSVARGAALYAEHCALCHGQNLRGGGGVGVEGLSRTPSDLTVLARESGGVFPRGEVLVILDAYANGRQRGRMMRPFSHLTSEKSKGVKTGDGRIKVPSPQAALLAFLEASQRP